jgi:hypothetical protein
MHKNGSQKYVTYCSEYAKGKAKNPKCDSPHRIDVDILMESIASVLRKIADFSLSNKADFETLVKNSLAKGQTDEMKKQQKRIPQITSRLEQIDKVLNKLYEDYALGNIEQDRHQQLTQKYSEEYYLLKKELGEIQKHFADQENASGRAKKFIKLIENYCAFTDLTPTAINEFISKIVIHERDRKGARQTPQYVEVYFNYIGKFENDLTELAEPTEQDRKRMIEEIEQAQKEKMREYHRAYRKPYREKNLKKCREYERIKAREYRARKKALAAV